jgi:hypothetical protein
MELIMWEGGGDRLPSKHTKNNGMTSQEEREERGKKDEGPKAISK